jgi:uncharacterized protein YndB with AHSA1/START domain
MEHRPAPASILDAAEGPDLGELDRSGPAWRLRFVRRLPHSPERVWRALTEPGELEAWFPTTIEGERTAGATLTFTFRRGEAEPFQGRMIACEPPRLLEFMWGTDTIRFELEPTEYGTRLTLHDTVDQNGKAARDAAGWHVCLDRLFVALDTGDGGDSGHAASERPGPGWPQVHSLYQEKFGPQASTIGPPEGHPGAG